jgi:hypothetical protein
VVFCDTLVGLDIVVRNFVTCLFIYLAKFPVHAMKDASAAEIVGRKTPEIIDTFILDIKF